jgi:hypothetical protein
MKLAPVTTSIAVVLEVKLPLVPMKVSVYDPGAIAAVEVKLSVEEPEPVTVVGLKVAEEPDGRPSTVRETLLVKPFLLARVVVNVVPPPMPMVSDAGVTEIVNPGAALTTNVALPK